MHGSEAKQDADIFMASAGWKYNRPSHQRSMFSLNFKPLNFHSLALIDLFTSSLWLILLRIGSTVS